MQEELTPLEKKLLDEIIRPAISTSQEQPGVTEFYITSGLKYHVHFDILLRQVKEFYERNEGKQWYKVRVAADV